MNLLVDKYSFPFGRPLGLADLHDYTTWFGRFRPTFSEFGDDQGHFPSNMKLKLRSDSPVTESGFYDHFDSIFHNPGKRHTLRAASSETSSSLRSQPSPTKGKEYVIPIKIEASSRKSESNQSHRHSMTSSSPSASAFPSKSSSTQSQAIKIPVQHVRTAAKESPSKIKLRLRDKSRSPILSPSKTSSTFTHLTPTTEDDRCRRDSSNDVVLDCDSFFPSSRSDPKQRYVKKDSDVEVLEIDDGVTYMGESLRRKPLRNFQSSPERTSRNKVSAEPLSRESENSKKPTSSQDDEVIEVKDCCSHPEQTINLDPPTYPVYDYLLPILASQDRQIDYIRGDGNCFFRAVSKEVYGCEEYHMECRQAVCDLIQRNPKVFQQYVDHSDISAHVADMRTPATWATTCEIYATATLLDKDVYVLAPSPTNQDVYHWLLFSPRPVQDSGTVTTQDIGRGGGEAIYMTLCHTNGNHYDRITPLPGGCNCRLPPPSLNGVSTSMDLTSCD